MSFEYIVQLVPELLDWKTQVEKQLRRGDRTNEREYKLLMKGIEKLKHR